jgi:hypothetical protein
MDHEGVTYKTLRDEIAMMAMAELIRKGLTPEELLAVKVGQNREQLLTKHAYKIADAMLAAREKSDGNAVAVKTGAKRRTGKMTVEKFLMVGKRLGRKAIKTDTRTLQLARYMTTELPAPPAARDWTGGLKDWGMMLNDTLGDCTIAGCGHAIQVWTKNATNETTVNDNAVLTAYEQWDGYDPNDVTTDQGGVELDVLTNWRKSSLAGHTLTAFAAVNVKNLIEVRQAIELFGGIYIGLALPLTAQGQTVWDVVSSAGDSKIAGSWGGHCVYVPAYDANGFTCITWGALQPMTKAFWNAYCDEAYALIGADWINEQGKSPSGFDSAQLAADLSEIQ